LTLHWLHQFDTVTTDIVRLKSKEHNGLLAQLAVWLMGLKVQVLAKRRGFGLSLCAKDTDGGCNCCIANKD
jgi:hypothetical protein